MSGFPRRSRFSLVLLGAAAAAFLAAAAFASAQFLPIPGGGGRIGDAVSPAATPAATVKPVTDAPVTVQDKANADTKPRDESSNPPGSGDITVTCDNPGFDWTKNPKVATLGKFGFFPIAPTGPGYYSLLDLATGNYREAPPKFGYPRIGIMAQGFFDTDWRYVDDPNYDPDILERLHRIHLGDNWLFATGGEFRYRWSNEVHSRLTAKNDVYDLTRTRVFADLWYKDTFRIYAEFMSAQSFNQGLPNGIAPLISDRDYATFENLFIDLKFFQDSYGVPYYVRVGRQEVYLGSQRLASALDWSNTRRTFDGVRVFRHGEKFDIDAFFVQLVVPRPHPIAHSDHQQDFAGLFTEYRPTKSQAIDLYAFYLDNDDIFNFAKKVPAPFGQLPTAPYEVTTLGGRYAGNLECHKNVLFDFEDMIQFGHSDFTKGSIIAGSTSNGLGYNFCQMPMNPTFWAYYDYATGSRNPLSGQMSTFNQLYPFGHYYFGWLDYVARSNNEDLNFHLYLYPTKWVTFNAQFHCFWLASATDALYSAGGAIQRFDPTGKSGRNVGRELDLIVNFHLTPRQDLIVAYGHLWDGRFLKSTGPGTFADTTWLMYTVRW